MSSLRARLLVLSALLAGACDDDDGLAELEEFRQELGEVGLSRVVIARMYQDTRWTVKAVPEDAPVATKVDYVCSILKPLLPTYVSGLVRLEHDTDLDKPKGQEIAPVFAGVKSCLREHVHAKTGRKVRFDVVINALHFTAEGKGVANKAEGLARLKARVNSIEARLAPDGYFFDFFSEPWVDDEDVYHPDALAEGIALIHKKARFVGGNILRRYIPKGADFAAFTDRGGPEQVDAVVDALGDDKTPLLLHIRNDPHCIDSEGRKYVEGTTAYRKRKLRRHLKWEQKHALTYMYPVLFPLYAPNDNEDPCDHGKQDPGHGANEGYAFDASQDGNLLDRIREHMGPAPKKGEPPPKKLLSDIDALPSPYDLADEGLIAVHRADEPGVQHLSTSLHELEEDVGLALGAENYFALARSQGPGAVPLHRCDLGGGRHLLTADPGCELAGADEGVVGFIGAMALDDTVPLHRLARGEPRDYFYTTSALERDASLAEGYVYEGVVGHVWDELGFAVPELPEPPAPPPDPEFPCAAPLTPVYRGYHTLRHQHLFAVNHDELLVPNMTDEGVPFQLVPGSPTADWAPLYRCLLPKSWHLLTTDAACEGAPNAIREGVLGNIARSQLPGTLPVRRYFRADPDGNDHLYVLGSACADIPDYTCEGIVGYVCPAP